MLTLACLLYELKLLLGWLRFRRLTGARFACFFPFLSSCFLAPSVARSARDSLLDTNFVEESKLVALGALQQRVNENAGRVGEAHRARREAREREVRAKKNRKLNQLTRRKYHRPAPRPATPPLVPPPPPPPPFFPQAPSRRFSGVVFEEDGPGWTGRWAATSAPVLEEALPPRSLRGGEVFEGWGDFGGGGGVEQVGGDTFADHHVYGTCAVVTAFILGVVLTVVVIIFVL